MNLEQFGGVTGGTALTVADLGLDVALDSANNAYVTGIAYSKNFPTTPGAFQTTLKGANAQPNTNPNAFVAKFDYSSASNAASLVYSTYLGGAGDQVPADAGNGDGDLGFGVAVDAAKPGIRRRSDLFGQDYRYNDRFPGDAFVRSVWADQRPGRCLHQRGICLQAEFHRLRRSSGPATSTVQTTRLSRAWRCTRSDAEPRSERNAKHTCRARPRARSPRASLVLRTGSRWTCGQPVERAMRPLSWCMKTDSRSITLLSTVVPAMARTPMRALRLRLTPTATAT